MHAHASLLLAGSAIIGVLAAPRQDFEQTVNKRASYTPSGEGIGSDGYFYSIWSNGGDDMSFTNGDNGRYDLTYSGSGDVVCGKGWEDGAERCVTFPTHVASFPSNTQSRNITYTGTFTPDGGAFLSLYGWFEDPLVEYYILEDFGTADPSYGITFLGNHTSDGSVYSLYKTVRENAPSIKGVTTFDQYWSIRQDRRVGGTITTANHYNAWKAAGLELNTFHYQILATEGISGSGKSSITVSEGSSDSGSGGSASSSSSSVAAPSSTSVVPESSSTSVISESSSTAVAPESSSTAVSSSVASPTASPPSYTVPSSASSSLGASSVVSTPVSPTAVAPPSPSTESSSITSSTAAAITATSTTVPAGVNPPFPHPHGTGAPWSRHYHHHHHHPNGTGLPPFPYRPRPSEARSAVASASSASDPATTVDPVNETSTLTQTVQETTTIVVTATDVAASLPAGEPTGQCIDEPVTVTQTVEVTATVFPSSMTAAAASQPTEDPEDDC
jgi:endo-1,4-beta-xylanase